MTSNTVFVVNEQIQKLRQIFAEGGGWEQAWLSGTTPWDAGHPQPALESLLESGDINFPKTGKALVPGCGKGYDPIIIAKYLGLETIGLDISPTAVALAQQTLQNTSTPPSNVRFEVGDFFKLEDSFDLIYDYTFFQALPPSLRPAWGKQMSSLIKPGGYLIILAAPLNIPVDVGPPYGTDTDTHKEVLGNGWEKLSDDIIDTGPRPVRLMVWRKVL